MIVNFSVRVKSAAAPAKYKALVAVMVVAAMGEAGAGKGGSG